LTKLEDELDPERFIRVHRSTIVNVNEVRGLKKNDSGSLLVMLADGTSRGVSRTGRRRLSSVLPAAS
jgi:two-component system LytT family response regulator